MYEKHWWLLSDLNLDDARDERVSWTKVTKQFFQCCFSNTINDKTADAIDVGADAAGRVVDAADYAAEADAGASSF